MGSVKDTDSFVKALSQRSGDEYTVLGTYTRSKDPISVKHNPCGNIRDDVSPDTYLRGNGGKGYKCNHCSGKWKRTTTDFIKEVEELYGKDYTVLGEYVNRHTDILIKHNKCGGRPFPVRPKHFLDRRSCGEEYCVKCSGKQKKNTEHFKQEVYKLVGDEYQVKSEYVNARISLTLFHKKCGEQYPCTPDNFLRGKRCPFCRESKGEKKIAEFLKRHKINFIQQYRNPECRNIKPLPFDFAILDKRDNPIFFIEFDGEQHFKPSEYYGGLGAFQKLKQNDKIKNMFALENGIFLIRIPYFKMESVDDILSGYI
ncbi:hypothetical protein BKP37_06980 [Anaerobacillus alkalilacustris]|uniref:DUF2726 domain-containing protein n=1 Tax=Anaerobacillus alkalilacustris TaxID=393763 RepID=A0A1S2LQY3_9BACI|nr:hypothetical protein [Anaerobacillus alkalilacustris]OIJ14922.1 hypothetical protein BKP37_06980 [Anaerobacillus alkalilacustris]